MAHPITMYGTPVLHQKTKPVTDFGPELRQLIEDMFASMAQAHGVGLAANQIGVDLQVFVIDCPDDTGKHVVAHIVNPKLELPAPPRNLDVGEEGCLSVPGQVAEVARTEIASVTGLDMNGDSIRIDGKGMLARCLQHEYDHLQGMVYVDRLTKKERKKVLAAVGLSR